MKKELFLPFVLVIFLSAVAIASCFSGLVFAQPPTSVEQRLDNLRQRREQMIEAQQRRLVQHENRPQRKEEIAGKVASREAQLRERVVTRIKQIFANILKRFNAALGRLDKIAKRIASRIDKLKAKGVNTAGAEAALAAAEQKGASAAVSIENAKAQIGAIDISSSPKDAVHAAINAVRSAKQALKDYHRALVEAIKQLKAANALREGTESAK